MLNHLDRLEAEAVMVIREACLRLSPTALLFSGGKDSSVLLHCALKAFAPSRPPLILLHIDTGHNFSEVMDFLAVTHQKTGLPLVMGSVEEAIQKGIVPEGQGPIPSRNRQQGTVLKELIAREGYGSVLGGGRRDEEKARAKERFFSIREKSGGWDPLRQRPELWNLFNTEAHPGEHFRVFPLNNWTEIDVWEYIERESIALPSLYYAHEREVLVKKDGQWLAHLFPLIMEPEDRVERKRVRCRTVGDVTCSALLPSEATSPREVIHEILSSDISERGVRLDDRFSETALEERKTQGYF